MNYNKTILVGRLTANPELRSTTGGSSVCNFSMATNRRWTNKAGEKQEDTQFHNCVAWGRTAEVICQFITKGSEMLIEGRLQTREYTTKDGSVRKITEIVVEGMQFGARPAEKTGLPSEGQSEKYIGGVARNQYR